MYDMKILNFFLFQKIKKTCKSQCVIQEQINSSNEKKQTLNKLPPLIAKLKSTTKIHNEGQTESDGKN